MRQEERWRHSWQWQPTSLERRSELALVQCADCAACAEPNERALGAESSQVCQWGSAEVYGNQETGVCCTHWIGPLLRGVQDTSLM
jgi:hypothetical protein